MSKIVFISNRLPVTASLKKSGLIYQKSIGGLATGLEGYHRRSGSLWIGWPGLAEENLSSTQRSELDRALRAEYKCIPVFLSGAEVESYYHGFCNRTIWPLFHYFPTHAEYSEETFAAYERVNRKFFEAAAAVVEDGDTVWVHDYQLMLLPQMLKERFPSSRIGFFLHIPFPSFEVFRSLIWREEILRGLMGSDLIGFHTYDYVRHFLSSTRRILGLDQNLNRIAYEDRFVQVDAFPMGIEYERFAGEHRDAAFRRKEADVIVAKGDDRMILSIDRLDYTKGIPGRLRAFDRFLEKYPDYRGHVKLHMIVAPSRVEVAAYENLRREITELVGEINGRYGTISWMPVWFMFQSFSQENLIAFYRHSEVLLVTPLRDGMNLVAKEYMAARTDMEGMTVISETAGAANELGETVVVNPNDTEAIADGIHRALEMPREEKIAINRIIKERLRHYNVEYWADEFLRALERAGAEADMPKAQNLEKKRPKIEKAYRKAQSRILFLDYDGTLVHFRPIPAQAKPDPELTELLGRITADPANRVVLVSGRDRSVLDEWFGDLPLHFIAAHGLWRKDPGQDWSLSVSLDNEWKPSIRNLLDWYADRMPGALVEDKEFALAFHYRQCEPDMVSKKIGDIREALLSMTSTMNLGVQEGNKVLEIKDNRVNKGFGIQSFLQDESYDLIIGAGDDFTDEDLFAALPKDAYTIKIGIGTTGANYYLKSWKSMRHLLRKFAEISGLAGKDRS